VLAVAWPSTGAAQEYAVDRRAANQVVFTSRAATEEFQGVTSRIDGYVLLDGPALGPETGGDDTRFYFEVDLASLDTGIGLRNRHMRDNYLEVARYPFATFAGRLVRSVLDGVASFRVTADGEFTVHGVSRRRQLSCRVEPSTAGYRTRCDFEVLLSDHDIEIPKIMFLKLANEIRLTLDFSVVPATQHQGGA
jgi:polyisoprenoid-binding protein YceI